MNDNQTLNLTRLTNKCIHNLIIHTIQYSRNIYILSSIIYLIYKKPFRVPWDSEKNQIEKCKVTHLVYFFCKFCCDYNQNRNQQTSIVKRNKYLTSKTHFEIFNAEKPVQ